MNQLPNKSGRIHVQFHGNHPDGDSQYFDWDNELSTTMVMPSSSAMPGNELVGSLTSAAMNENSAAVFSLASTSDTSLEEFEEFNLDDCEELTEEEKDLLLMYIQNNQGSVVFTDPSSESDDMHDRRRNPIEMSPEYGDYYSGRFLETIYEEDSDDLRSWDSDEVDEFEVMRYSPSSDEPMDSSLTQNTRKKSKEMDKDSSYDSDFSFVNSTECLDNESQIDELKPRVVSSDNGLSSDDEASAILYNDDDIEDALCQVNQYPFNTFVDQNRLLTNSVNFNSEQCVHTEEEFCETKLPENSTDDSKSSNFKLDETFEIPSNCNEINEQYHATISETPPCVSGQVAPSMIDKTQPDSNSQVEKIVVPTSPNKIDNTFNKILSDKIDAEDEMILSKRTENSFHGYNHGHGSDVLHVDRCEADDNNMQPQIDNLTEKLGHLKSIEPVLSRSSLVDSAPIVGHAKTLPNTLSEREDEGIAPHYCSASEVLYETLPKVEELPEIKELCYSWFGKAPETVTDMMLIRAGDAPSKDWQVYAKESKLETGDFICSDVIDNNNESISGMCEKHDSSKNWEQWLAQSLDEKSGRHLTSGTYLDNHVSDQTNLHNSDVADQHILLFNSSQVDGVTFENCAEFDLSEEDLRRSPKQESLDSPSVKTHASSSASYRRGHSLPRNYEINTSESNVLTHVNDKVQDCERHDLADFQLIKSARGNSLSDISVQSVGGSRESVSRFHLDCSVVTPSVRQRSKSTPDLSSQGGRREDTLVKQIEHTSQVKLEVCELSPGLQYKKHCVIVNESVSAKKAKFEALHLMSTSSSCKQILDNSMFQCRSSASNQRRGFNDSPQHSRGTTHVYDDENCYSGNQTPEVLRARVNSTHLFQTKPTPESHQSISVCRHSTSEDEDSDEVSDEIENATMKSTPRDQSNNDTFVISYRSAVVPHNMSSPSNGMFRNRVTDDRIPHEECVDKTAQLPVKTDVSKLVAMFEDEIKKSEPRSNTTTLVVRGGERNRNVTSPAPTSSKNIINVSPEHFNKITGLQSGIRATACKATPSRHTSKLRSKAISHHWPQLCGVSNTFSRFRKSTREERVRLAKSVPDLPSDVDKAVSENISSLKLSHYIKNRKPLSYSQNSAKIRSDLSKSKNEDEWDRLLTAAATHYGKRYENAKLALDDDGDKLSKSYGYLETDLDTLECRKVDQTNLDDYFNDYKKSSNPSGKSRTKSLISLGYKLEDDVSSDESSIDGSRAKSMEFLLDDVNKAATVPPENQLMRDGKVPSEHELRFQKSLKNLTLPSWYRESSDANNSVILDKPKDADKSLCATPRWEGLNSKSSSATSLSNLKSGCSNKPVIIPKRISTDWRYVKYGIHSSKESLTPQTPSTGPDSPVDDNNFSYHPSLSRWNTARMSTTSNSSFGGGSLYRSFRQPYLGWRSSVEKLSATSGHPSNTSSQCPSPSSSAISAASSSFAFKHDRPNFNVGLSRWGNVGTMNLAYATDTDSEIDSRPSSALAGRINNFSGDLEDGLKSQWKLPCTENQQVGVDSYIVKNETTKNSELQETPLLNGHFDSKAAPSSPSKHVWMESSFVGKKNPQDPDDPLVESDNSSIPKSGQCAQLLPQSTSVQPSERPQGEYYAMLRNQHKSLVCT
ncbi:hypothetical protein GQR58_005694 [Nymphon striatum]|nr:hypothetical protein GQR58_005694 [Nymphon striatum]